MSATRRHRDPPGNSPRHSPVRAIVHVACVSRVATITLMILANAVLPTHDAGGVHKFRPRTFPVGVTDSGNGDGWAGVLSAFTRWDSAWFLSIADSGYPRSFTPDRSGSVGDEVDCGGMARAWGGENYEYNQAGLCSGTEVGEERHGNNHGHSRDGERRSLPSETQQQPRCLPDIPLEEQAHAFFPLYPWLVRWTAATLRALLVPGGFVLGRANSLVLAGVLISNSCFVAAAVLLYQLGTVVTGDSLLAHRGALAFCVTPASVFFSTAYTESLYAALSFAGLLFLFSEGRRRSRAVRPPTLPNGTGVQAAVDDCNDFGSARDGGMSDSCCVWWRGGAVNAWVAAVLLSLATLARSNGIAGAGVLVLEKLRWMAGDAGLFDRSVYDNNGLAVVEASRPVSLSPPAGAAQTSCDTRGEGTGTSAGPCGSGVGDCRNTAAAVAAADNGRNIGRVNDSIPWVRLAASLVATALQALLILAPYVFVQAYAYRKFCLSSTQEGQESDSSFGKQGDETIVGTTKEELMRLTVAQLHPWCTRKVPSVYAHIQSAYWGVGAFRYYQWKQIPNFLLAAPALILTAYGTARFFLAQLKARPRAEPEVVHTTRGKDKDESVVADSNTISSGRDTGGSSDAVRSRTRLCPAWLRRLAEVFFGPPELPHPGASPLERTAAAALIAQWAFLGFFAAVCMNVQVATRFLAAACPPLHWFTASLLVCTSAGGGKGNGNDGSGMGKAVDGVATVAGRKGSGSGAAVRTSLRWYLGLYFIVGAVLHANFLPWT